MRLPRISVALVFQREMPSPWPPGPAPGACPACGSWAPAAGLAATLGPVPPPPATRSAPTATRAAEAAQRHGGARDRDARAPPAAVKQDLASGDERQLAVDDDVAVVRTGRHEPRRTGHCALDHRRHVR